MQESLYDRTPESTEQLWIVNWSASGTGKLLEELSDPAQLQAFVSELDKATSLDDEFKIHHSLTICSIETSDDSSQTTSRLNDQFHEAIGSSTSHIQGFIGENFLQQPDLNSHTPDRLSSVFQNLNSEAILNHARKLGVTWIEEVTTTD